MCWRCFQPSWSGAAGSYVRLNSYAFDHTMIVLLQTCCQNNNQEEKSNAAPIRLLWHPTDQEGLIEGCERKYKMSPTYAIGKSAIKVLMLAVPDCVLGRIVHVNSVLHAYLNNYLDGTCFSTTGSSSFLLGRLQRNETADTCYAIALYLDTRWNAQVLCVYMCLVTVHWIEGVSCDGGCIQNKHVCVWVFSGTMLSSDETWQNDVDIYLLLSFVSSYM